MSQRHPHDALPIGARVGLYEVARVLGQGGFGIVYEASHTVLNRRVALKELFVPDTGARRSGSQVVYSFTKPEQEDILSWARTKFRETTTLQFNLDHPGICKVIDYLEANDTAYMLMEYLDGSDLTKWLGGQQNPLPLDMMRTTFEPVLDALSYLHQRGLVHRDIKPDNVFMTGKGPVLIDFGALSHDLTRQSRIVGLPTRTVGINSPGFTAPEQCQVRVAPSVSGDIYSFGALLYYAMMGTRPADALDRAFAQSSTRRTDAYQPIAAASATGIDRRLAAAVDACLAYYEEDRPRSAAILKEHLGWNQGAAANGHAEQGPRPKDAPRSNERTMPAIEQTQPTNTGSSTNAGNAKRKLLDLKKLDVSDYRFQIFLYIACSAAAILSVLVQSVSDGGIALLLVSITTGGICLFIIPVMLLYHLFADQSRTRRFGLLFLYGATLLGLTWATKTFLSDSTPDSFLNFIRQSCLIYFELVFPAAAAGLLIHAALDLIDRALPKYRIYDKHLGATLCLISYGFLLMAPTRTGFEILNYYANSVFFFSCGIAVAALRHVQNAAEAARLPRGRAL